SEDSNGHAVADQFSVPDVFNTRIRASQFTLVACGSAHQSIQPGDEPLGLVTALLCAGANSVLGTMWNIQIGASREFLKEYIQQQTAQAEGQEGNIIDLAVAFQRTIIKLKKPTEDADPLHAYHWAAFVLHGSWLCRSWRR